MTPTNSDPPDSLAPKLPEGEQTESQRSGPRPGGHSSYRVGGEPAIGHRFHEAPPPPPAPVHRFDDGVPHRRHEPGEIDLLHNEDVEHEHSDINIRAVIASAIIMVVVVAVSQFLMWGLFGIFERQARANDPEVSPLAAPQANMPKNTMGSPYFNESVGGPQLLTNEPMALGKQRDTEQKRLHGYGWVNQGGGVAHMPIDEAKKLIVERGLPARQGEPAAPALGTRLPARGEASGGRIITTTPPSAETTPPAAPPTEHGQPPQPPAGHAPAKPGPGGH